MTTIVYRDGVLAADTGMCIGGVRVGFICKIARSKAGDLAGAAGAATYNAAFLKWFVAGEQGDPPEAKRCDDSLDRGAIFRSDGTIQIFEPDGSFGMRAPYYALGCGRNEAMGAMFMGADAVQAVKAAMASDIGTFGDVDSLRHAD